MRKNRIGIIRYCCHVIALAVFFTISGNVYSQAPSQDTSGILEVPWADINLADSESKIIATPWWKWWYASFAAIPPIVILLWPDDDPPSEPDLPPTINCQADQTL
ncbi:MAG: hypothetical protein HKN16_10040, partial [Saprospiraceae bacterium]|nr:hypothetical protein [Saprospiraceae bacterium]